ncbi:hypothetical protein L1049_008599 [Liquidambar formosana]|uniref:Uncharacterized protein n=1 Tax=Liquidambar formosana TaxID=63359 RepID=A0AAP0S6R9_LIQFO
MAEQGTQVHAVFYVLPTSTTSYSHYLFKVVSNNTTSGIDIDSFVAMKESNASFNNEHACEPCRSFGQKCNHLVKKQRTKFYILRRCIAMLVCWHERGDP